jgi:hypothetical protein
VIEYVAPDTEVDEFNRAAAHFDRQIFIGHAKYHIRTLDGHELKWRRRLSSAVKAIVDEFPSLQPHATVNLMTDQTEWLKRARRELEKLFSGVA